MRALLREDVLAWLAVLFLGGGSALAAIGLLVGRERLNRAARWCAGLGGYLLLLSLLARGVSVRGLPLVSVYEVVLLSAAAVALFYALGPSGLLRPVGGVCAGLPAFTMVLLALLLTPAGARAPQLPPPPLQGVWFPLHVVTTAVGYGGLIVAGVAAGFRLLVGRERQTPAGSRPAVASDVVDSPPPEEPGEGAHWVAALESLAWRGLAWGYPWLTLGMTIGGLWGWLAWGRYWSWSVKEVLTLLTWGAFTLAFHSRRLRGWRGRPHAAIVLAGLVLLLLTLLAAEALAERVLLTTRYIF